MKKIITMMLCATISLLTLVGCGEERKENISSPVEDTNQSTELKMQKMDTLLIMYMSFPMVILGLRWLTQKQEMIITVDMLL